MDTNAIIAALRERGFVESRLPQGHHVEVHERQHREIETVFSRSSVGDDERYLYQEDDFEPDDTPIDDFIWIANPEVDLRESPTLPDLDQEVRQTGVDALAWYRSFHWEPVNRWGIYIRDAAVYSLAASVFRELNLPRLHGRVPTTLDRLRQAFRLLYLHEFFHYVTDVAASTLELGRQPPYVRHYAPYVTGVYMRPRDASEPLEEALANAFAYEWLPGTRFRAELKRFMRAQPGGYSAFQRYLRAGFDEGRRDLATSLATSSHIVGMGRPPLELLIAHWSADISFLDVPVHIIREIRDPQFALGFVRSIPLGDQVETDQFRRDLRRLPDGVAERYRSKTRRMLDQALQAPGLNFEALRGCDTVFSARIDRGHRITVRPREGKWELLRIGKHDDVYRNPGGC